MSETRTVFKALRKDRRGYHYSAIVYSKPDRIHYPLHKTVHAPNGCPPLAFETESQACNFADNHRYQITRPIGIGGNPLATHKIEVWECEATGVTPIPKVTCNWISHTAILEFWRVLRESPHLLGEDFIRQLNHPLCLGPTPPGTVSCQTIKLVRKVA